MSIKIHHGAPGSYKTSGAVLDDFIPAVLEGRHIITNVNGLSDADLVRDVLEEQGLTVPETFKLTYLDTTINEVMEQVRRWFHWAEPGVFFLLDEIQLIYPPDFKPQQLKEFDYPRGLDAATSAGRFLTVAQAFEQHRHKNWDFILTTPNITKVHKTVRGCAEMAYRHKNLAVLGGLFAGRYIEANHGADNSGRAKADIYTIQQRKIPKYVFRLYKSTQTGVVRDTKAGKSIFKEPKMVILLAVFVGSLVLAFSAGTPRIFGGGTEKPLQETPATPQAIVQAPPAATASAPVSTPIAGSAPPAAVGAAPLNVVNQPINKTILPSWVNLFTSADAVYVTNIYQHGKKLYYSVQLETKKGLMIIDQQTLRELGLSLTFLNRCFAKLVSLEKGLYENYISCPPFGEPEKKDNGFEVVPPFQNPFAKPEPA